MDTRIPDNCVLVDDIPSPSRGPGPILPMPSDNPQDSFLQNIYFLARHWGLPIDWRPGDRARLLQLVGPDLKW